MKKKESTNFDALCICVGDRVSVENHGKHWIHLGHIISFHKNTKSAVVKWEETRKKDTVHLGDCRKPSRYVLYKCTYVPYDGTFGMSNQGQTLDV